MKRCLILNTLMGTVLLSAIMVLTSCATSRPPEPVMPPSPPEEEILSIETDLPDEPAPPEVVTLPDGVTLFMDNASVTFESLPPADPQVAGQTVTVQASPSTPYRNVERVLEKLHDLGYLIDFTTTGSP